MDASNQQFDALLQDYLRRNRRLRRWAWLFTLVPVAIFALLSLLVASKAKEYARLSRESAQLNATIQQQKTELDEVKKRSAVQQLAINIVKQQSPGVRPKVVVYRLAVAGQVEAALTELGYSVEQRLEQANPTLANKPVDTLSYGCAVGDQDIRTVATALTKAGLLIRRIAPAEKNKDPDLIQLVSSRLTSDQKPLKISEISAWSRKTKPCPSASPPKACLWFPLPCSSRVA
jgi:hypothetical protein